MSSAITQSFLASLPIPNGLTLVPGGSLAQPLPLAKPPPISLASDNLFEIQRMLSYVRDRYDPSYSPAADLGAYAFKVGRALSRRGGYEAITFDWDHTLGNYQIFENVAKLIHVRLRKERPPPALAKKPMIAIEMARPFMHELAFGTMAGFALRQGLKRLDQWENYEPQVGIATHTWPDRLGMLAAHFTPLLPLMEGLLPGSPSTYETMTGPDVRSVIHLHDFLDYAEDLIGDFGAHGFRSLTPAQRDEVMAYLEDGKAHYRKPLGAFAMKGWETSSLLHFDDSTTVISDLEKAAARSGSPLLKGIHIRHPHSNIFRNVQEWHKITLSGLWRRHEGAMRGAVTNLARMEWENSAVQTVLRALGALNVYPEDQDFSWPKAGLPEGVVMTVNETPTTLGEFWEYYVAPTNRLKTLIQKVISDQPGGLPAIRRSYREAVSLKLLP